MLSSLTKGTIKISDEWTAFYLFLLVGTHALVDWGFLLKEHTEQIHPNGIPVLVFGRFVLKATKGPSLKQLTVHCSFLPARLTRSKLGTRLCHTALAHLPSVAVRLCFTTDPIRHISYLDRQVQQDGIYFEHRLYRLYINCADSFNPKVRTSPDGLPSRGLILGELHSQRIQQDICRDWQK